MKLQEKLRQLKKEKAAILAANFYNYETLRGILHAASGLNQPVILQLTKSSIDYMGLKTAAGMARAAIKEYNIEAWLHLDHSKSVELVERCLDEGFDSVMIDASEYPFEENVKLTLQAVKLAEKYDANVEAELGYVPKPEQDVDSNKLTEPGDAKRFVEETSVNALAVAIGTAHGFYKAEPKLDFERLANINNVTNASLVLHGGSGIPGESIRKAVELGICKVNVATETKNMFMQKLTALLNNNSEIDLRQVFPPAINAVSELIKSKMQILINGQYEWEYNN
ncbi:MAG: class II fructose-bisphosphate aldolase [Ignavibacteria bacterium]|jgi:fructose-bisphosphate aldolase class II/tagatose 1,6-diphosphate aldolase GatY/KbaY